VILGIVTKNYDRAGALAIPVILYAVGLAWLQFFCPAVVILTMGFLVTGEGRRTLSDYLIFMVVASVVSPLSGGN